MTDAELLAEAVELLRKVIDNFVQHGAFSYPRPGQLNAAYKFLDRYDARVKRQRQEAVLEEWGGLEELPGSSFLASEAPTVKPPCSTCGGSRVVPFAVQHVKRPRPCPDCQPRGEE